MRHAVREAGDDRECHVIRLAAELEPGRGRRRRSRRGGQVRPRSRPHVIGSDFEKQMVADTPLGRLGQPDDIAKVAVFLASDDSGWLTGERLQASGGLR